MGRVTLYRCVYDLGALVAEWDKGCSCSLVGHYSSYCH